MMLTFDDELGARHFEFCFVGFILGGSLQEKKGMSLLRTEVGLFEKLELISDLKPCGKKLVNGERDRQLQNGEGSKQLHLTSQEYDLLYNYLSQVPWQAGTPAKHALETIDWLDRAQRASRGVN
jgi:hypothetical protein